MGIGLAQSPMREGSFASETGWLCRPALTPPFSGLRQQAVVVVPVAVAVARPMRPSGSTTD